MINLDELIEKAHHMKPLPVSVIQLISLVTSNQSALGDLEKVISMDAVLTGRLLRAANSAIHVGRARVSTIHDAVLRMGTGYLLSIAMAACVEKDLNEELPQYGFSAGQLWSHSVAAALAIRTAPRFITKEVPPESYVAALLHDIGKLVLARFLDPNAIRALQHASQGQNLSQIDAEKQVLQIHHGEVGGLIAQHWKMPESIVQAITNHHSPIGRSEACYFVWMSNLIAHSVEEMSTAEEKIPIPDLAAEDRAALCKYFHLSDKDLNSYCLTVSQNLESALKQYS